MGFPDGSYSWRATDLGGGQRCAKSGDIASILNPKSLRCFELVPSRPLQVPKVIADIDIQKGVFDFHESGLVRLCKPHLLDEIKVIRRRDFSVGSGLAGSELWFLGLMTEGLPAVWVHVRPGFTEVTLRPPPK